MAADPGRSRRRRPAARCAWRSVRARHLESVIEEPDRHVADRLVDRGAVDPGRVDAGLRKLVFADLVALVDEDLVVDLAGMPFSSAFGT